MLCAWRTARSANSALRPRSCARLRRKAAASLTAFSCSVSTGPETPPERPGAGDWPPGSGGCVPIAIGVAAPRFDAGDIAAIWLAYRMYVPALAARAPVGPTQVATGTVEFRMSLIIARIDVSSPPGVSSSSTTSEAPWA